MSIPVLIKKELFIEGNLNKEDKEMIEILVVNVPGVKSGLVDMLNKRLILTFDSSMKEEDIVRETSILIKTYDSNISLKESQNRDNKKISNNSNRKNTSAKVTMVLGGLNCAHCAEVINQKVSLLEEVTISDLNFVSKKLNFELKDSSKKDSTIKKVVDIINTTEPGLDIQILENKKKQKRSNKVDIILGGLNCAHCSEVINQKVSSLDEVSIANLNFVNKKLSFELKDNSNKNEVINKVIDIINTTEPGLDIQVQDDRLKRIKEIRLKLEELTCIDCAHEIEANVRKLDGVESVSLDFANCNLDVDLNNNTSKLIVKEQVTDICEKLEHCHNIKVETVSKENKQDEKEKSKKIDNEKMDKIKLIIGSIVYVVAFIQEVMGNDFGHIGTAVFIAAYLIVGGDVLLKSFKNIKNGRIFDENFLMTVATLGAIIIGETSEAVGVMLFYRIGIYLQGMAVGKSRKSIAALMEIRPDVANLKVGNRLEVVNPEEVDIGDIIVVKPGERVPLDGRVIEGSSMLDTSALTGESVLRSVNVDDEVLSGFINKNALLTIEVTKDFGESAVSKVLDLVENASSKKAKTENFISVFCKYYTPAVVGLAILLALIPPLVIEGADFKEWILRGLTFLVVSCPCALVLSIPLTFFSGIGYASKNGVLIKGSNYLEALRYVDTVVFDKTGTLTKGVFDVTKVNAVNVSEQEVIKYAAYAEANSNHPIAKSIVKAYNQEINLDKIGYYEEVASHGIVSEYEGKRVLAGNEKLMKVNNIKYIPATEIGTVVYIAVENKFIGSIVISDEIKRDSKEAISKLKEIGIKQTVMLTGDNKKVADSVASELKIDKVYSDLLPDEKVEKVEEIYKGRKQKEKVVFVGDGINDAPVLARVDVGIAMGGLGSDAAIEAADVVIMTDEPSKISKAIAISKKTNKIVWQNIIFALSIKAVVLALTAGGLSNMWEAIFADVGVALIAVFNAMRAMK